jgi:hypothetical protein
MATDLSVDNPSFKEAISYFDVKSQNHYVRSCERYLIYCNIQNLRPEATDSVPKFLKYCRNSKEENDRNETLATNPILSKKETTSTSSLWSILSHLKKLFNTCCNRDICNENKQLNKTLQQWEKTKLLL